MKVNYAKAIFGKEEIQAVNQVLQHEWLAMGREVEAFEQEFAKFVGRKYCVTANSGSSANLLAITVLELPHGSGVITPTCTFPTTINPIIQNLLLPILVDSSPATLNVTPEQLTKMWTIRPAKAVFLPHTLGNPFDLEFVTKFCEAHEIPLIEDCCDALGSTYKGKQVGTFGLMATYSFYPAHHMTTGGEGGAIVTDDPEIYKKLRQYRDWGRSCWCKGGQSDSCGKRFSVDIDGIEYDHKYMYEKVGYNLQMTEMQAAFGRVQIKRLPGFIKARRRNHCLLKLSLKKYSKYFMFQEALGKPSWFAFAITLRVTKFTRRDITKYLEHHGIETRLMFGGNIMRHLGYRSVRFLGAGTQGADKIMKDTFFIGVNPSIKYQQIKYIERVFGDFIANYKGEA